MTNSQTDSAAVQSDPAAGRSQRRPYDLEERTALFGETVIEFAKQVPVNPVTRSLIDQLVRAGTSVGANYCEADDASSNKEFRQKIGYCRKEARETKHWVRMIAKAEPELREAAVCVWQESKELHLIFAAILRKGDKRSEASLLQ